jgi:sortase A
VTHAEGGSGDRARAPVTLFAYRYASLEEAARWRDRVAAELDGTTVDRVESDGSHFVVAVADGDAAALAGVADWGPGVESRLPKDAVAELVRRHREHPPQPGPEPIAAPATPPPAAASSRPPVAAVVPEHERRYGGRRILSDVLLVAAVFLAFEGVLTIFWQEPFSALWTDRKQSALSDKLERVESRYRREVGATGAEARQLARLARRLNAEADAGEPVGRVKIPDLNVKAVMIQGTDPGELREGPGHYPGTPLPGMSGAVGVAGHRTTFSAPFRHLDELERGDTVDVEMPYGVFRYEVQESKIVAPDEVSAWRSGRGDRLFLTSCNPPTSDAERLIVIAGLVDSASRRGRV